MYFCTPGYASYILWEESALPLAGFKKNTFFESDVRATSNTSRSTFSLTSTIGKVKCELLATFFDCIFYHPTSGFDTIFQHYPKISSFPFNN